MQMTSQSHQIIPANFFFNNDLEYLREGSNDKKYTESMTKYKAARYELQGIEDMVPNLWSPVKVAYDRFALLGISHWYGHLEEIVVKRADQQLYTFNEGKGRRALVGSRKLPEEAQPHQAKNSRYELHKFSDGTFTLVRDTLSQMLHDLHLGYNKVIRRRQWTRLDQQRTRIMIKAINQNLLERRIMRSLEKLVGGREYVEDLRLLQHTI
ncbi:hypothetical protein Tco_1056352 [Tanacetum coccineum]|uniref:Uncharacterized protein n=1 Tax=Tanacetum coccineum TaxID=301880 RepID=A0ABQ5H299_9ASTR